MVGDESSVDGGGLDFDVEKVLEKLNIGTLQIDNASGKVSHLSESAARLMGFESPEDGVGRGVLEFYADPKERAEILARLKSDPEVLRTGIIRLETQRVRSDTGEPVDVLMRICLVFDDKGALLRTEGTVEAMAEQQTAKAWKESQARFRILFEQAGVGLAITSETGMVTRINDALCRFMGAEAQQIVGRDIRSLLHPDDRGQWPDVACDGTSPRSGVERRFLRDDGSELWGLTDISWLCDDSGTAHSAIVLIQDLTERHKAEAALLRAQRLESLAVLAGGIAHDFNNLLTGVVGSIGLASASLGDSDAVARYLASAELAALRARDLTRQLITFARGGEPTKGPTSVAGLVDEARALAMSGSNVGCKVQMEPELPLVEADAGQIVQVLSNLLLNAIEAMPDGGDVLIRAHKASPDSSSALQAGDYVRVQVEDNGPGVPADIADAIFDPYVTTKAKGSGLGLATSHSILKRHGGALTSHPVVSGGARFDMWLPVSSGHVAPQPVVRNSAAFPGTRVLVMDDEPMVRDVCTGMLAALGCEPVAVPDGREALIAWDRADEAGQPFDVAILDLTVPGGMGGVETLEHLAQRRPGLLAIVSSGYSADWGADKLRRRGFVEALSKPYTTAELHAVLERVLMPGTGEL